MLNVREKKFGFDSFRFVIRIIVLSVCNYFLISIALRMKYYVKILNCLSISLNIYFFNSLETDERQLCIIDGMDDRFMMMFYENAIHCFFLG